MKTKHLFKHLLMGVAVTLAIFAVSLLGLPNHISNALLLPGSAIGVWITGGKHNPEFVVIMFLGNFVAYGLLIHILSSVVGFFRQR